MTNKLTLSEVVCVSFLLEIISLGWKCFRYGLSVTSWITIASISTDKTMWTYIPSLISLKEALCAWVPPYYSIITYIAPYNKFKLWPTVTLGYLHLWKLMQLFVDLMGIGLLQGICTNGSLDFDMELWDPSIFQNFFIFKFLDHVDYQEMNSRKVSSL